MLMEFSRPLFRIFSATFVICSVNFRVFDFQDSSASRRVRRQRAPHAFGQRTVEAVQERIDSNRRGWGGRGQGVGGRYFCTAFSLFLFLNRTAACSLAYSLVNTVILSGWPRGLFPFFLRSCDSQNDPLSNESATTAITATAAPLSGRHVVVLSAFDPHRQALTFHTPCTPPTDPVRIELLFFFLAFGRLRKWRCCSPLAMTKALRALKGGNENEKRREEKPFPLLPPLLCHFAAPCSSTTRFRNSVNLLGEVVIYPVVKKIRSSLSCRPTPTPCSFLPIPLMNHLQSLQCRGLLKWNYFRAALLHARSAQLLLHNNRFVFF